MASALIFQGIATIGHKLVPLLLVLFVLTVIGSAVAALEYWLAGRLRPAFPPVVAVLIAVDVLLVGAWAYRWSPLRVRVRHRRAAHRLRGTRVSGPVHAVIRGRVTQVHGSRHHSGAGLAERFACPRQSDRSRRMQERIDVLRVGSLLVAARRTGRGYEDITTMPVGQVRQMVMRREQYSAYRLIHSTPYDADRMVISSGLRSEDFALVLTDGSSMMVTGGPPEEIDRLR